MKKDKLSAYLKKGLKGFSLLGKMSFTMGFLLVAVYFYHIGYFPAGSDKSIFLDIISIVAFAGIFFFFIMTAAFIFAPYNWINLISMPDVAQRWFGNDAEHVINSYRTGKINFTPKTRWKIGSRYLSCTGIYFLILHGASYFANHFNYPWLLGIFFIINISVAFGISLFIPPKRDPQEIQNQLNNGCNKNWVYLKIIGFTAASGFYLFMSVFLILLLTKNSFFHLTLENIFYTSGTCIAFIFASLVCLLPANNTPVPLKIWIPAAGSVFILFICFSLQLFPNISSLMMRSLKLGNINSVTLQIDNTACQLFEKASYPIHCDPQIQIYFVNNIDLKWGAGEYYVSFKSGSQTQELFIPQAHILGKFISESNKE